MNSTFYLCLYNIIYTRAGGGGESSATHSQASWPARAQGRRPSSGAAPLLPLGPAGMLSIVAPSPKPNQMGQCCG